MTSTFLYNQSNKHKVKVTQQSKVIIIKAIFVLIWKLKKKIQKLTKYQKNCCHIIIIKCCKYNGIILQN